MWANVTKVAKSPHPSGHTAFRHMKLHLIKILQVMQDRMRSRLKSSYLLLTLLKESVT